MPCNVANQLAVSKRGCSLQVMAVYITVAHISNIYRSESSVLELTAVGVSSRFAETRFAEIRVRGWCLPDSPKPDLPKPVSPKLGFRVRV